MNQNIFDTLYFCEKQAKSLRLLATVYLEWDHQRFQEKALDAVNLANKVGTNATLGFTATFQNMRKNKSYCLFLGVYEHIWGVLEDQDTAEMPGLGRRRQSRLVLVVKTLNLFSKNDITMSSIRVTAAGLVCCMKLYSAGFNTCFSRAAGLSFLLQLARQRFN